MTTNASIVRFELLMDAGEGAQKAGDILLKALARTVYVYSEPIYPSEISPPRRTRYSLSGVIIRIADFDMRSIGNDSDVILSSQEVLLNTRLQDNEYHKPCKILLDMGDEPKNSESYAKTLQDVKERGLEIIPFNIDPATLELLGQVKKDAGGRGSGYNMYYLGILSYIFQADPQYVIEVIHNTFKKSSKERMEQNVQIFNNGYALARDKIALQIHVPQKTDNVDKIIIDGNSAMALGIIDAGIKFYGGYPITPATSIMHYLSKHLPSFGGQVHQAEDEIAAVGATIGAYYGGVPAITCTSGPGLSLKQEFIGLATAAEIPLIVVDVQRGGPSTGIPTRTEQSDVLAALAGSHGDNVRIVLSITKLNDCFYVPHVARYLTEKLRIPVIILHDSDKANSMSEVKKFHALTLDNVNDIPDGILATFNINRIVENVEMVANDQSIPGTPGHMQRLTGLNFNQDRVISYASDCHQRAHRIRNEKLHIFQRAVQIPELYLDQEGDVLIVGWGSTSGSIREAVRKCSDDGLKVSSMHFKVVYPLPLGLREVFTRFKHVVTVERAYGDRLKPTPFTMLLRNETLVDVQSVVAQATGRPVTPNEIRDNIKALLANQQKPPVPVGCGCEA